MTLSREGFSRLSIILIAGVVVLAAVGAYLLLSKSKNSSPSVVKNEQAPSAQSASPSSTAASNTNSAAAKYCKDQGNTYLAAPDNNSKNNACVLKDNVICPALAFFDKTCPSPEKQSTTPSSK